MSNLAQTGDPTPVIISFPECVDRAATADSQLSFLGRCKPALIKRTVSDHIQQIGILCPWHAVTSPANTIRSLQNIELTTTPRAGCQAIVLETRKVQDHAVTSSSRSFSSRRCPTVAHKSLRSHAAFDQVDLERRDSNRRCCLATECLWTVSFPVPDARWIVNRERRSESKTEGTQTIFNNTADICLKEIL
jgi:hypothetical protein